MSDFTVVDKGELSDYREYLVSQGVGAGVATGCFAFGVTVLPKVGFAGAALFTGASLIHWYSNRDQYQAVRKVIRDARGENQ